MTLKRAEVTEPIIGEAIAVHRELGPGNPEAAYREALARALDGRGVECRTELPLPIEYDGLKLDCGYRLDIVVPKEVVVELKSVERLLPIHSAQLLTYMRLSGIGLGLLLNFNVYALKQGIQRMLCDRPPSSDSNTPSDCAESPDLAPAAEELSGRIIAAGIKVHRRLGPGLLASAYEACLKHELARAGFGLRLKVAVPLSFRGRPLHSHSNLDMLVEEQLPVQIHSVDALLPIHMSSLTALLRQGGWPVGLLLNFNVARFSEGVRCCYAHPQN